MFKAPSNNPLLMNYPLCHISPTISNSVETDLLTVFEQRAAPSGNPCAGDGYFRLRASGEVNFLGAFYGGVQAENRQHHFAS